jgi:hypothetical protein
MTSEFPIQTTAPFGSKSGLSSSIVFSLSVLLGLLVAAFDLMAPFGDDTEKATIVLLAISGGLLGFLQPRRPWRWGLIAGPWMPFSHAAFSLLGWGHAINPNTSFAYVLLLAVSVAIATGASYAGAILRRTLAME